MVEFARAADDCFKVEFFSFGRSRLPEVLERMSTGGFWAEPGEVVDQDPTYLEFGFNCDGADHDWWIVWARYGRECPTDLVAAVEGLPL